MKQLVADESLSEEARESAKKALEVLVSSELVEIEQVAALKKVESEAQFALNKLKAEDAAEAKTIGQKALAASAKLDAETTGKLEAEAKKLESEAREEDYQTLAASKKEVKEWLRSHRLQDYVAEVTRIAGSCVALCLRWAREPWPDCPPPQERCA